MIRALTSSALSGMIRTALQFLTVAVVATFIKASDYGLYALALPFAILTTIVFDAGFGPLVVRPKTIEKRMISSLHALALAVGVLSVGTLLAMSFGVGAFFPDPRLPSALKVMAIVPLLGITAAVPRAVLERELRYDTIAKVEVLALAVASSAAITLAIMGAGVWSLFALSVIQASIRCVSFNTIRRISLRGSTSDLRRIYADGKWVTLQNLQIFVNRNLDNLLVGAYLGTAALGVYAVAYQVVIVPLQAVSWPFGAVLMSQLRRIETPEGRTKALNAVLLLTLWLTVPVLAVAAVVSPELVALYLKPSWKDLPFLVQVLSLCCTGQLLGSFYGTLLVSYGDLRLYFYVGLLNTICLTTLFLTTTLFLDLEAMVIAYTIYSLIYGVVLLVLSYRRTGSRLTMYIRSLAPPLLTALLVLGCGLGFGVAFVQLPLMTALVCKAAVCLAVIAICAISQLATFKSLMSLLRGQPTEAQS